MVLSLSAYRELGLERNVITVGSYDGVHSGHKQILSKVISEAKLINGNSIVITFDPHPRQIIQPDKPIFLIDPPEQKYQLLEQLGIDYVVVVPFSRAFSLMSAEEYIHDFIMTQINPHTFIIGYDHQFGKDRKGNIDLLRKEIGDKVHLIEIDAKMIDEMTVSSTKVREAIAHGDFRTVSDLLGRHYSFRGIVIHGRKLGRTIGYPTANLQPNFPHQLLPPKGIYAVTTHIHGHEYMGAMSIGKNPTVTDADTLQYEVYLLDFDDDIYGENLSVSFIEKIRDEEKFDSLEALQSQIKMDVDKVRNLLCSNSNRN